MPKVKAKKNGRPVKECPAELADLSIIASVGFTDAEIAILLGCSEKLLNNWKKNKPGFLQSLKSGKLAADFPVVRSLYKKAIGYQAVAKDGTIIDVPGDTPSMIFWLKNRQPDRWRDRQTVDAPGVEKAIYELSEKFLPAVQSGAEKSTKGHDPK